MNRRLGARVGGGLSSLSLRKSLPVATLLGVLVVIVIILGSHNELRDRHRLVRVTGHVAQAQHEYSKLSSMRLPAAAALKRPAAADVDAAPAPSNSVKSLKELVKEAVDRGLVVIVNATEADAARLFADNPHGARPQWDINGALDGPTGEILAEVIQELRNMEELEQEVAELKSKIKKADDHGEGCLRRTGGPVRWEEAAAAATTPLQQGKYKFRAFGAPLHPLVIFSTFRFSLDEFTAVGLAAGALRPRVPDDVEDDACVWMDWDATSATGGAPAFPPASKKHPPVAYGKKRTIYLKEGADVPYDVVLIKCAFDDPAGSNGYGGHLFIWSGEEHIPVLSEPPEAINQIQFEGPLTHPFAFCTPPLWAPPDADLLKQWLMYHHGLAGAGERTHFFVYHGVPLGEAAMRVLRPLVARGAATLIDLGGGAAKVVGGPGRFSGALLALNDCLQRSRFFADWALFWGFNEYLQVHPPRTLAGLVGAHGDRPYITFGTQIWSTLYCAPPPGAPPAGVWATDRLFLRLEHPVCGDRNRSSLCAGAEGERKWAANPRKLYAGHVHYTIDPSWGGADVPTEVARLNKYGGPGFVAGSEACQIVKVPADVNASLAIDGYWFKDLSFAAASAPAHALAHESPLFNTDFLAAANWTSVGGRGARAQNRTAAGLR